MPRQIMRMLVLFALAAGLPACGPLTFTVGAAPEDRRITATVVEAAEKPFADRVAIVDVSGLIYNYNRPGLLSEGDNPVSTLAEQLEAARRDFTVRAIILRINSPGGAVTASDAMYREIRRFKDKTHKPVVALLMDVAASGGYYVACASDKIVAYPTSVTGSIGVIVQTISFKPALTRWGIQTEAITSGPNKDVGSPLSEMTAEHRQVLRALVNDFYGKFQGVVRQARPNIPADRFGYVTDGRVVSGEEALSLGLVDQLGDLHDAFDLAKKLADLSAADLILYHRPLNYVGSPYAQAATPAQNQTSVGTQVNLAQFNFANLMDDTAPGFYYLWDGGPR